MLFDICQGDLTEEAWFFVIFVSFCKPRFVLIRLPKPDILAKIRAVNPSASTACETKKWDSVPFPEPTPPRHFQAGRA